MFRSGWGECVCVSAVGVYMWSLVCVGGGGRGGEKTVDVSRCESIFWEGGQINFNILMLCWLLILHKHFIFIHCLASFIYFNFI